MFLESANGADVNETRAQLGPTVAVSRRLNTVDGEMMVTVVGEIPIGTAERIALSVRGEKPPPSPEIVNLMFILVYQSGPEFRWVLGV